MFCDELEIESPPPASLVEGRVSVVLRVVRRGVSKEEGDGILLVEAIVKVGRK
jgi:hypothetical protein